MMNALSETDGRRGTGMLLGIMFALAGCIAVGGALVARREVETRRERDRQAQRALGSAMQAEARKLEQLYDAHLTRTGELLVQLAGDPEAARKAAQNIEGIARVSWLYWKSPMPESHVTVGFPMVPPPPEPTLEGEHPGLPRPRVLLEAKTLFLDPAGRSSGWIDEPGKPLMHYVQMLGQTVLLTIDRSRVEAAMTGYLQSWLEEGFGAVKKLAGADAVLDAGGRILVQAGPLPEREPDVLNPVVTRFGVWNIASWDERLLRAAYHMPTLTGSLALAVLVAGCGIGLGVQQRRAALQARQRVSFVNRVSHELRTPMTNILMNLDLIEEAMPDTASTRFALVREEAGRLGRLIENVLTFSRREQGRLSVQCVLCHPARIVNDIVRQFEPALARRGIDLTVSHENAEAEARLDADALAQITANLLSNAEKYAPEAALQVATRQSPREFVMQVTDAGPGIAVIHAERIFEPFFRLDDRVQEGVSGTGLGLSIARDLARRMGGDLRLQPMEKGARFELSLPLTTAVDTRDLSQPAAQISR